MDSSNESFNQSSVTAWSGGRDGSASFGPSGYGTMTMQPFAAPNMMPQSSMMAQRALYLGALFTFRRAPVLMLLFDFTFRRSSRAT